MPGISAVIITKNEENSLERCLFSLREIVDEILILDSFSTDGTEAIAQKFGARFLPQEWLGYAATKNKGNELASGDYILSLDADEALSEELRTSLLRVKSELKGCYSFNRLNHYAAKPIRRCGWYPDRKMRLFPKGKANWQGDFVHEEIVKDRDLEETWLEGDLLHYTYSDIADHVARSNRYSSLAAKQIAASSKGGLRIRAYFSAALRFLKVYFLKMGFAEGFYGLMIARVNSREVWLKYMKALEIRKKTSQPNS